MAARELKYRSARMSLVREPAGLYGELQGTEATTGFPTEVYAEGGGGGWVYWRR